LIPQSSGNQNCDQLQALTPKPGKEVDHAGQPGIRDRKSRGIIQQ
jgi:hypothetical protein